MKIDLGLRGCLIETDDPVPKVDKSGINITHDTRLVYFLHKTLDLLLLADPGRDKTIFS